MITRGSIRRKSVDIFKKVIELRKKGYSYSEIKNKTGVAKSTINNWLVFAGLTLTKEHLQIQSKKRVKNHVLGTAASRITRARRKNEEVNKVIQQTKKYFNDPFFVAGIILYETEGTKSHNNNFSNSDFRLISLYVKFLEKYFLLDKNTNFRYRVYIHDSRKNDLGKILSFWSKKLSINYNEIRISWKHNNVSKIRFNPDYVGQMGVSVVRCPYFLEKLLAISDIILAKYQKI